MDKICRHCGGMLGIEVAMGYYYGKCMACGRVMLSNEIAKEGVGDEKTQGEVPMHEPKKV